MKSAHVPIVDDSSRMRKIVERSLRQAGLDLGKVVEAGNGMEAPTAARGGVFDLILSRARPQLLDNFSPGKA